MIADLELALRVGSMAAVAGACFHLGRVVVWRLLDVQVQRRGR